jgi:hypothetical protein
MRLSDQAVGTLMMALQKCLLEQSDIVEILKDFDFVVKGESQSELIITNPPTVSLDNDLLEELEEARGS